ncbi:hypothetical protein CDV57_09749 [Aspergillus fumigatus]|nr:hypothetical protein CDV57_09749 [Aspergillus fumigatus]
MRVRRRTWPGGEWMASVDGLSRPDDERVDDKAEVEAEDSIETAETEEPPAEVETMLSELAGRAKSDGETPPVGPESPPIVAEES